MPLSSPGGGELQTSDTDNTFGPEEFDAFSGSTGNANTVIGARAGQNIAVDGSVIIGVDAGNGILGGDAVIIGNNAADAGLPLNAAGSVIIGESAAGAQTGMGTNGEMVIIGFNALANHPGTNFSNGLVIIGGNAFENNVTAATALQNVTAVGFNVGQNGIEGFNNCAFFGRSVAGLGFGIIGGNRNTGLGDVALGGLTTGVDNTTVGFDAGGEINSGDSNTIMGRSAGEDITTTDDNTIIGSLAATFAGANNAVFGNDTLAQGSGVNGNTVIGSEASAGIVGAPIIGDNNVLLGRGAGNAGLANSYDDFFILETRPGAASQPILFGDFTDGNICIGGNATAGAPIDRDFSGTNICKIQSGTAPSANPTGGGFLYVTLGALNYRGTGGTITALAIA